MIFKRSYRSLALIVLLLTVSLLFSCSHKFNNPLEAGLNHAPNAPSSPYPADGATNQGTSLTLGWSCADPDSGDALSYDVYLGTTNPPTTAVSTNQTTRSLAQSGLSLSTTYYWKVVAKDNHVTETQGTVWRFSTGSTPNNPPTMPANPNPASGATGQPLNLTLSWTGGDPDPGDTAKYDVYFDTANPPVVRVAQDLVPASLARSGLSPNTNYYWQIVSKDRRGGMTTGPIWNFQTRALPNAPSLISPANGAYGVPVNPTVFLWGHVTFQQAPELPVILPAPVPVPVTMSTAVVARFAASQWASVSESEGASSPVARAALNGRKAESSDAPVPSPFLRPGPVPPRLLAITYQIQVATDTGFGSRVVDQSNLIDTTYSTSVLTRATTYYWRVRATDSIYTGPWSVRYSLMANRFPTSPGCVNPPDNATNQPTSLTLSWTGGDPDPGDTARYDVYFSTSNPPTLRVSSGQLGTTLPRSGLANGTWYYWRIVSKDRALDTTAGSVWRFQTGTVNNPPNMPRFIAPDSLINQPTSLTLIWGGGDPDPGDTAKYEVYFSTSNPPTARIDSGLVDTTRAVSGLLYNTTYYWRILARDRQGAQTQGPVWRFTTQSAQPWFSQTSGTSEILGSVCFPVDAQTGYAVAVMGVIVKTTDGGANWVTQTSGTTLSLHSVHFPADALTGYAVGTGATILKTTNGGANWVTQTSGTSQGLYGVHFPVDASTGYAVGQVGTMLKTTNGGANWVSQTTGAPLTLQSVYFPVDAQTGYSVGDAGEIVKTTDGGANWVHLNSGTTMNFTNVHFPDVLTGYIVGQSGTIRKTTDGGANWVSQTSGTTQHTYGVHFPQNASTGYVVAFNGVILKTTNGGANWVSQSSGTTTNFRNVHFPADALTGYVVGEAGAIRKTTTGGN